jgi:SAM-dependent methyltransferase
MLDKHKIRQFYTRRRGTYSSIYDAWEEERPCGKWATPAVYDHTYRSRIVQLVGEILQHRPTARILSVGCGNAFVEGLLVRDGFMVDGVDLHERSVLLARRRGVHAVVGDVSHWTPEFQDYDLLLMDGVLGHLYDPDSPTLHSTLTRLCSWLAGNGKMVISNDICSETERVIPSPSGVQFYRFSFGFLTSALETAGLCPGPYEIYLCLEADSRRKDRLIMTVEHGADSTQ